MAEQMTTWRSPAARRWAASELRRRWRQLVLLGVMAGITCGLAVATFDGAASLWHGARPVPRPHLGGRCGGVPDAGRRVRPRLDGAASAAGGRAPGRLGATVRFLGRHVRGKSAPVRRSRWRLDVDGRPTDGGRGPDVRPRRAGRDRDPRDGPRIHRVRPRRHHLVPGDGADGRVRDRDRTDHGVPHRRHRADALGVPVHRRRRHRLAGLRSHLRRAVVDPRERSPRPAVRDHERGDPVDRRRRGRTRRASARPPRHRTSGRDVARRRGGDPARDRDRHRGGRGRAHRAGCGAVGGRRHG